MKVLFDVTSLLSEGLTTNGVYTKNLFRLLKGLGVDVDPVYKKPRGLRENHIETHIGHSAKKFHGFFSPRGTILHGPSGSLLSEKDKFLKVLNVNDLSMFRDGMMSQTASKDLQAHLKEQINLNPKAVVVPTSDIHNEMLIRFPKIINKLHVIEPGCDHLFDSSSLDARRVVKNPYFLFSGTIDKKSNLTGVIKAFHGFCGLQQNVQLVIVGVNGFGSDEIHKLINSSPVRDRIKVVGHKSDAQLKKVYADAICAVLPSFYEGFSFPMVEAMKMGCPVLTSALGSMKDIGGDAVHLVNPKDVEQIMGGMERIFVDRIYRDKMVEAGHEIVAKMTWLKCANSIYQLYQKIS